MKAFWVMYRRDLIIATICVSILVLFAGCQSLGVTQLKRAAHSVEEGLLIAAKSGDGMTTTFMQLRVNRTVTSTQYESVVKNLQELHDVTQRGIDAYRVAAALCEKNGTPMNLCNVGEAQNALDRADIILHLVAGVLATIDTSQHGAALIILTRPRETPV